MILVVAQGAQVEKHLEQVLRLEPGIVLLGVLHTAEKQARANQRHQRQRSFRNHQQAAQTVVGPAQRAAAAAGFQDFVDVRSGSFDGGDDSEDQTGQQRDKQGESENAGIEEKINGALQKKTRPASPPPVSAPQKRYPA